MLSLFHLKIEILPHGFLHSQDTGILSAYEKRKKVGWADNHPSKSIKLTKTIEMSESVACIVSSSVHQRFIEFLEIVFTSLFLDDEPVNDKPNSTSTKCQ